MRILNKLVYACCSIAFGLMALPSCEGGELYDVNAPDWISEKVDSIANSKKDPEEEVLEGMQEDVYSFGNADYTSGFWTAFSKYYVVPDGQKWHGVFNLNINPADNTYYKNFALVITNDADRGGEGYTEYGAYRFDTTNDTLAYNSQWGSHLFFKYTSSTLMLSPVDNLDETVQKLGGKVTLTVDRTNENAFSIKIQNASATKTYKQPYKLPNLNADASNTNIRRLLHQLLAIEHRSYRRPYFCRRQESALDGTAKCTRSGQCRHLTRRSRGRDYCHRQLRRRGD